MSSVESPDIISRLARTGLARFLLAHRYAVQASVDGAAWTIALAFATLVRHDFEAAAVDWNGVAALAPLAAASQVVAGLLAGLYLGRWRFGGFEEIAALARATLVAGALVFAINLVAAGHQLVPRSAVVAAAVAALVAMGAARYGWRLVLERRRRPRGEHLSRLLVFGAGEGGHQVLTAILRDPESPYLPVGLLDDDPTKRNLRLSGVPVRGDRSRLADVAADTGADVLLIAIPSADGTLIAKLSALAADAGLRVLVLPPVADLFGGSVGVSDIRPLTEADLLGRHQVETDVDAIAGYLTGKRVLITGAGGSIGAELCRQIWQYAPAELLMLDRDESALHAVQLAIEGRALLDSSNLVLADIRDGNHLHELFQARRPEVVFHAAALKHLPLLEQAPGEAVKTNVWGSLSVLEAAAAAGVERFVNISTDKAANPTSVLGWSKRIAERLTAQLGATAEGTYLSVRFGNVLGSRGSVLTAFRAQIEAGGPVTVTDPDVTRYFMTVQEAVQLVIQAGAIGRDGEALVLDMGEPVRIDDVARRLAAQAPRPIAVVYTGLRPGEKLHEELFGHGEPDERPVHPLISHVDVPPLDAVDARALDPWAEPDQVRKALVALCDAGDLVG